MIPAKGIPAKAVPAHSNKPVTEVKKPKAKKVSE